MKPRPHYPNNINHLGDHIRQRRLDLGLFQREVAARIGVDESTIYNWETHRSSPQVRHLPQLIEFLGYVPFAGQTESLAERVRMARRTLGLTQKAMADRLGVDPTTIRRWEAGRDQPSRRLRHKLDSALQKLAIASGTAKVTK